MKELRRIQSISSSHSAMAGKGGKKKRNSRDSTADSQGSDEKKSTKAAARKKIGTSSSKFQGDIFNEGAMENAYIVCHNVQVRGKGAV